MILKIDNSKIYKYKNKYLIKCNGCGVTRWYDYFTSFKGGRKYCSRSCINSGKKHSKNHNKKISNSTKGENNPMFGKKHPPNILKKCREGASRSWSYVKKRKDWPEFLENFRQKFIGKNNPFYKKKHTKKSRMNMSKSKADALSNQTFQISGRGLKGWYLSRKMNEKFYHDSFYEYLRMLMLDLDENIIFWTKKHKIKIQYTYNKMKHYYVPDFKIIGNKDQIIIEEIKGYEHKEKKQLKYEALKNYCKINKYKFNILEHEALNKLCIKFFGLGIDVLRQLYKKEKNI